MAATTKEILLSRRENGLSVRYLAQGLVNDTIFPMQEGIRSLLSKARNGKKEPLIVDKSQRIDYYFFFHLEDFGSQDKSEIDILLRCGEILYPIEVKAFTNPNDTDVKREVVRNYVALRNISGGSKFSKVKSIIPLLLYSVPFHRFANPSAARFNYFNEDYIFKKEKNHSEAMTAWNTSNMRLFGPDESEREFLSKIRTLPSDLYFLTWDDVSDTMIQLNTSGRLDSLIDELRQKQDTRKRQGKEIAVPLVTRGL